MCLVQNWCSKAQMCIRDSTSGTLVNAIMFHCKDNLSGINGVLRPGIVHRIDKDTTCLLYTSLHTEKGREEICIGNPEHVQQPLIQAVVDHLLGKSCLLYTSRKSKRPQTEYYHFP